MDLSMLMEIYKSLTESEKQKVTESMKERLPELFKAHLDSAEKSMRGLSDDDVKDAMKPFKKGIWKDILFGAADAAGDIAKGVQDIKGTKKSLLADALIAQSPFASADYVDPASAFIRPAASAIKAKGYEEGRKGEMVQDVLGDIFDPMRERERNLRQTEQEIRLQPNTGYYQLVNAREKRMDAGRAKGRDRQR